MKFIVSSLKLLKNLQALSGVIGTKNTLPILDDFLFQLTENELKITTSDLDVTMSVSMVPDMVEGTGEVTIPATLTIGDVTYRVTAIANEAFKNCIHLTAVNIGSNVETIGVGYAHKRYDSSCYR